MKIHFSTGVNLLLPRKVLPLLCLLAALLVPAFYAYQTKVTTPFDHPAGLYEDPGTYLLKATAGGTYTEQYMFRLAETSCFAQKRILAMAIRRKRRMTSMW